MCSFPSSLSVSVFRMSWNLEKPNARSIRAHPSWKELPTCSLNLLSEGTEWVAEGFGSHAEQSLQEHVNLQRVKGFTLVWRGRQTQEDRRRLLKLWCRLVLRLVFGLRQQRQLPSDEDTDRRGKNWPSSLSWFGLGNSLRMAKISSLVARFLIAFPMVMATGYPGNEAEWRESNLRL